MTLPVGTLLLPLWVPVFEPQATAIIRSTPNAIEIAITDFLMPLPPMSRRELGSSAPAHECARARSQLQRSRKKTHYDLVGIRSEARGDECMQDANLWVDHAHDRCAPSAKWDPEETPSLSDSPKLRVVIAARRPANQMAASTPHASS